MHEILHVLEHALIDTLKIAPILLAVYFLIEFLEYRQIFKFEKSKMLNGKSSPVFGSLFGSLPQCGFSVVSTDLYHKGFVSIGALLAVYIATSDEALPIMLSNKSSWGALLALIVCKIALGILIGYIAMWLYPKIFKTKNIHTAIKNLEDKDIHGHSEAEIHEEHDLREQAHEQHQYNEKGRKHKHNKEVEELKHEDNYGYKEDIHLEENNKTKTKSKKQANLNAEHNHKSVVEMVEEEHEHIGCCHHDLESNKFDWKHPLLHCLKIIGFILAINLIFGLIVEWIGEDSLKDFLLNSSVLQPLLAVLIGLIPNCASSVVITELYLLGGLSFGSILAGLCVNAGLGLVVLFRKNKHPKEIVFILSMLIIPSLIVGYGLHFII